MNDTHYIPGHGPVFQGWPKIARLNRDIIITEKLDGTNAAIGVYPETKNICGDDVPTGVEVEHTLRQVLNVKGD